MPAKRHATPCFGAHMSVAGGLEKAIELAHKADCKCVQIFTKNNNQWACKPLTEEQTARWQTTLKQLEIVHPIAHASYLINLASPDAALWEKSLDALVVEWQRAELLGLEGLVVHPGAFTTSTAEDGLAKIRDAVQAAIERVSPNQCRLLLENTAGQGSCLGHTFGQLGWLLEAIKSPQHLGICLDTCHAFAAGYALNTPAGFRAMKRELKQELPADCLRALHLNDSKKGCGSRVDRHEHIGQGEIGDAGFRLVLNDSMFRGLPGYLETPKGIDPDSGEDLDVLNLRRLHTLSNQTAEPPAS